MKVNYRAILAVGVPYRDVVKAKVTLETVTRYHEETGEPYQKTITTVKSYLGSMLVSDPNPNATLEAIGLDVLHADFGAGDDQRIVGKEVAEADMGTIKALVPGDLPNTVHLVKAKLADLGCHKPIEIYLIGYVSY